MRNGAEEIPSWSTLLVALVVGATVLGVWRITDRAADGRLKKNAIAGMRTSATMASDKAWVAGHVAARKMLPLGSVVTLAIVGVGLVVTIRNAMAGFFICMGALVVYCLWMIPTMIAAHRAARDVDEA